MSAANGLEKRLPKTATETDFLDWHSELTTITTEDRKQARLFRDIYNQAVEKCREIINSLPFPKSEE